MGILLNPGNSGNVLYLFVLRFFQVAQHCACGNDAEGQFFNTKPFERGRAKMFGDHLIAVVKMIDPFLQAMAIVLVFEELLKIFLLFLTQDYFRRPKTLEQLVDVNNRPLRYQKLTGREIQESNAQFLVVKVQRRQVIIAPLVQHLIVERKARRHQLSYPPLHQPFGLLRVFKLITDSYTMASPH